MKNDNVRISINQLVAACLALNAHSYEVLVIASGSLYATLICNFHMREVLSNSNIHWSFD